MICGRRKYSSKYGIAMRVCNMNLVSQRKALTFVAPGQKFNPSLVHISLSQTWLESQTEGGDLSFSFFSFFLTPPLPFFCGLSCYQASLSTQSLTLCRTVGG